MQFSKFNPSAARRQKRENPLEPNQDAPARRGVRYNARFRRSPAEGNDAFDLRLTDAIARTTKPAAQLVKKSRGAGR